MPACVDKNQQSGGVCYNGECVHQYFTAFFMYFRGKKRHFKIKCNRSPLFFFYVALKFSNFGFFFNFEISKSPACLNIFCLESEDQEFKLVWPNLNIILIVVFVFKDYILFVFLIGALGMRATVS